MRLLNGFQTAYPHFRFGWKLANPSVYPSQAPSWLDMVRPPLEGLTADRVARWHRYVPIVLARRTNDRPTWLRWRQIGMDWAMTDVPLTARTW